MQNNRLVTEMVTSITVVNAVLVIKMKVQNSFGMSLPER